MSRKINLVTTVSGNSVDRINCRKIQDEYYEKNVDCFEIDGRWYRKGNPTIYFNEILQKWMKIGPNTVQGIINVDGSNYTYGYIESCFENSNFIETKRGRYLVATDELFEKIPKKFSKEHGKYFDLGYIIQSRLNLNRNPYSNTYPYSFERLYNSENLLDAFTKIDNSKYVSKMAEYDNVNTLINPIINKYSFGLEIETAGGIVPENRCKQLGLIPLRDGSIHGHEYTTIPMKGMDGINLLLNQLFELNNRCIIDKECSLHVHFGNFPLDESKIINLYNLCYFIQNEIGTMFPEAIFNSSSYKEHGKDYCRKLPQQMKSISDLYYYLSGGNASWDKSYTNPHPMDRNRDRKWEVTTRYHYVNFINLLFGNKVKTVEFRIHTPTINKYKIIMKG